MATLQAQRPPLPASRDDFAIAIICALPEERDTVEALMTRDFKDEGRSYGKVPGDDNSYTVGEIGGKPVVLVAPRNMGTTNTRDLARGLRISFPNISYAFVVGIAGGAPFLHGKNGWKESDIHLGDVIVSTQVIEYDFGREHDNGFRRRTDVESVLPRAPAEVTNFVNQFVRGRSMAFQRVLRKTKANLALCDRFEVGEDGYHEHPGPGTDDVYGLGYRHKHRDPEKCAKCSQCTEWYHEVCEEALAASCHELGCEPHHSNEVRDTKIHFGRCASGNAVMKSGHRRDLLIQEDDVIGFEMEGAGAWEVFGTIVVKGVVDYADSHKNKKWRGYPAARAALCAAAMIEEIDLPDRRHAAPTEIPRAPQVDTRSVERHWLLPRRANPQYFGYTHILDQLASCLLWQGSTESRSQVVCVLSGMGGVGKSESILQFVDKNQGALRERYWGIFWVDCESETSARTDFERIGKKCGWSPDSVRDQLVSAQQQSLLILDNCDDVKMDYNRYIPIGSQVSVALTTRLSDARKYASADPQDMGRKKLFFWLDGLDTESAVDLVLEASDVEERSPEITSQATQIATALDFHPLALNAASSLIQSAVYSLQEYADALHDRLAQKELLETESEQARYLRVSTTFEVSAESLQRLASTDPTAKAALALLDILGFMHHQDVSEDIFVRAWEYEEEVLSQSEYIDEDMSIRDLSTWHVMQSRSVFHYLPLKDRIRLFRKARALLVRLSLASIEPPNNIMSLHLMVHTWARERVSRPAETWTAVASMLALSASDYTDWQPYTSQLVCHLETIFANWRELPIVGTTSDQLGFCRILFVYAWQMLNTRSPQSLDTCLQLNGQIQGSSFNHGSGALAKELLARAYTMHLQMPEALEILEHLAKMREEKLEEDHPDRVASQHNLAAGYLKDGQTPKALEMLERVVKVREKLKEDDPSRLSSQRMLATAYLKDGQNTKAIELLERVVEAQGELKEDDTNRLSYQHALASAYLDNEQVTEAIEILEHLMKVNERLPEDHPHRLFSQQELARVYQWNGRVPEAIEILEHVAEIRERLPEGHVYRLSTQGELACAYQNNGQVAEAIEILEHVVNIKKRLPEGHASRLASQHELARAYWDGGRIMEAIELLEHVVSIDQQTLRNDDSAQAISVRLLACIKKEEYDYNDGETKEDGYEDLSSDQGSTGSQEGKRLARITKEDDDDDYDYEEQCEGDDEDESDVDDEGDGDHEDADKDSEEQRNGELSSNQGSTDSETSESVVNIEHFRRRRNKLALRPRHQGSKAIEDSAVQMGT